MKEQIKNIIESYCEGINHLEFNIADLDKMADEILVLQLQQTGVMHCFSGITEEEDSIENLVIDYNAMKYLNDKGFYDSNFKLIDDLTSTAPIFTALKEAEKQMQNKDNQILLNLLKKRIK